MIGKIELNDVVVKRGRTRAVDGVTLTVSPSSWFGIIGANGSGKTSLLRALAGRLPLDAETCRIDGRDLNDRATRAGLIGFAPPIESLPNGLKAAELLGLAALGEIPELGELGAALGIPALLDRWIGDCSAGMRQRVAIAAAFAAKRPIVVLDEPFNWLDPVAAFDVKRVLRRKVQGGLTLITALHDIATLSSQCDAGMMMRAGRIALDLGGRTLREAASDLPEFERKMIDALRREEASLDGRKD